jgi:hypothetical protein
MNKIIASIALFVVAALVVSIGVHHTFAEDGSSGQDGHGMKMPPLFGSTSTTMPKGPAPMLKGDDNGSQPSFGIQPSGQVMLQHGTVTASSGSSLTVSVQGFSVSFVIDSGTQITGTASSTIATGDTVNIKGSINSSSGVITAKAIQDQMTNAQVEGIKAQIKALLDQLHSLQAQFHL